MFTSGQIPVGPHSGAAPEGIAAQSARSCVAAENLPKGVLYEIEAIAVR